ncbi:hypothetical protein D3C87_88180 [compost metagenome]
MKILIALITLFPFVALAQQKGSPQFTCMTTPVTSDVFVENAKSPAHKGLLQFSVVNHYGAKGMPFHEGVITPSDFNYLKAKADVMVKLGDSFSVLFQSQDCEVINTELVACHSNKEAKVGGLVLKSYRFVTKTTETKVYEYTFKSNKVTFSFVHEGMTYDMPLSYASEDCKFTLSK